MKQILKYIDGKWRPVRGDGTVDTAAEKRNAAVSAARLDDMLEAVANGEPLGIAVNTDNTFMEGHCNNNELEKMDIRSRGLLLHQAKRHKVNIKGKRYLGSLAAYPGDPFAWVSGKADVERVVRRRNWNCQGSVNVRSDNSRKARQPDPKKFRGGEIDP